MTGDAGDNGLATARSRCLFRRCLAHAVSTMAHTTLAARPAGTAFESLEADCPASSSWSPLVPNDPPSASWAANPLPRAARARGARRRPSDTYLFQPQRRMTDQEAGEDSNQSISALPYSRSPRSDPAPPSPRRADGRVPTTMRFLDDPRCESRRSARESCAGILVGMPITSDVR